MAWRTSRGVSYLNEAGGKVEPCRRRRCRRRRRRRRHRRERERLKLLHKRFAARG